MGYFGIPFRNGVPIGLGSVASFGIQPFDPSYLFAAGEQGAWYDPADLTTLFQDSAGTTAVTAVEQPVGLMLDKSKGLVLGSEAVVTPLTGSSSGSWAIGPTSITRNSSSTGQANLTLNITPSTNVRYVVSFTVANLSGDTFFYRVGSGGAANQITANGTYTVRVLGGGGSASLIFAPWAGAAGEATITNISVRELPGNHAFQTNNTKRPVLSGRVNLLTKTEDFADAAWTKQAATVTQNAVGPNGVSNTATTLTASAGSGNHWLFQGSTVAATPITCAIYAKAGTANWLGLSFGAGATTDGAFFNLANGTVGAVAFGSTATIQNIGNGWYFCKVTRTPSIATTYFNAIEVHTANSQAIPWTAAGTETLLIWGADLRVTNTGVGLPPYQRVNTSTDYDTAGFPLYLKFDGVDDAMTTNSVDFSAGDKMTVFAGVRKLSDAAIGFVTEFSDNRNNNPGSWVMAAPSTVAANYIAVFRGSVNTTTLVPAATFTAPITNVLTGIGDIAADTNQLRVNGSVFTTSTDDIGTGNFGNYPLFIAARNQTSFYLNGNIYSLIIRGAQSTAEQISATEAWVNQRTAAY